MSVYPETRPEEIRVGEKVEVACKNCEYNVIKTGKKPSHWCNRYQWNLDRMQTTGTRVPAGLCQRNK